MAPTGPTVTERGMAAVAGATHRYASMERARDALERAGMRISKNTQNHVVACCPVHEDSHPSLDLRWQDGSSHGGGMTLMRCHACQAPNEDVVAALGLRLADLYDEPMSRRSAGLDRVGRSPQQRTSGRRRGNLGRLPALIPAASTSPPPEHDHAWVEVDRYCYTDVNAVIVQAVIREECTVGARHKRFRQEYPIAAGGWARRKPSGFTPSLYRAPAVAAAVAAGQAVWLVEGEKDVHAAEAHGLVATTNAQGSASFTPQLAQALAGAQVVVVLDRDEAGWARGIAAHQVLVAVGAAVSLRLPAIERDKADLSDHLEAGKALEDLVGVCLEEVAAWNAHAGAGRAHRALGAAGAQLEAHLQRAEQVDDDKAAGEHRSRARRWAQQMQVRFEELREAVADVHGHAMRAGTSWAGAAITGADAMVVAGAGAAYRAHLRAGEAAPAALRQAAGIGVDAGAPDRDRAQTPDQDGAGELGAGRFRVEDGQIVEYGAPKTTRGGQIEQGAAKVLLSTVVTLVARKFAEVAVDEDVEHVVLMGRSAAPRAKVRHLAPLAAVQLSYRDPASGEAVEFEVAADAWEDHSWIKSLPFAVDYDHRRSGLESLRRAIIATSPQAKNLTLHRSTGWRSDGAGGHYFTHAGGGITAGGRIGIETAFSSAMVRYDLPDPTQDAAALREAFYGHSGGMMDRLPDKVAAPLLGHAYRSALGHNPWVAFLVGPPSSYKTSVASKVMHHFGEKWDHTRPGSSMSGNGDTFNTLRFKLHQAKDVTYWMDDFAPSDSWINAVKLTETVARLLHNQEERGRTARDGQSVTEGTPPRASGLCTSEVMPRPGSGAQRMLVVPLDKDDVDTELLFALDEAPSRHGRALVMSSFISWLAEDLPGARLRYLGAAEEFAGELAGGGQSVRASAAVGHTWAGWAAMSDFLFERGAISDVEHVALRARVHAALLEASTAASDPDQPRSTGARVLALVRYALEQNIAHVEDVRTADCPPWPMGARLGWRRQILDQDHHGGINRQRFERAGAIRLGYVMHDPGPRDRGRELMCGINQLEAVVKAAGATLAERLEIDGVTAVRALDEMGALVVDRSDKNRRTSKCTIHCEGKRVARMVTIRLDVLLGDEGQDQHGDGQTPAPQAGGPARVPDAAPTPPAPPEGGGQLIDLREHADTTVQALDLRPMALTGAGDHPRPAAPAGRQVPPARGRAAPDDDEHEEDDVAFISRPYTDAQGIVGYSQRLAVPAPCVMCGQLAAIAIEDVAIHVHAFAHSTAATRDTDPPTTPSEQCPAPGRAPGQGPGAESPTPGQAAAAQAPTTDGQKSPVVDGGEPPAATPGAGSPAEAPAESPSDAPDAGGPPDAPADQDRSGRRQSAPGRRVAATAKPGFRAAAAVVDVDGIWCSNGEHLDLTGPIEHVGDLVDLAAWLNLGSQVTPHSREAGQVWLGRALARRMGIDVQVIEGAGATRQREVTRQVTSTSAAVQDAVAAGYGFGGGGSPAMGAWTRVFTEGARAWVVLIPALFSATHPLLDGAHDNATLARRLGLYATSLGHPFQITAGVTGMDLLGALHQRDRERLMGVHTPVAPAMANTEIDFDWCRPPDEVEAAHGFVHAYDRSGSYLAAAASLDVGVGAPTHHPDGAQFTSQPGYWSLVIPDNPNPSAPHLLDPTGRHVGTTRWVATPALALAAEQGWELPAITEAYTWPGKSRVFDSWCARLGKARTALDVADADAQAARDQIKLTYAATIGLMGSHAAAERTGYAPERRHAVIAKARANIMRRITQIGADSGRWPVAVFTDAIIFTSPHADPVQAWPGREGDLGRGLGKYKVAASAPLADHVAHLSGGAYRGMDALLGRDG